MALFSEDIPTIQENRATETIAKLMAVGMKTIARAGIYRCVT
jgi:hypothetical protein